LSLKVFAHNIRGALSVTSHQAYQWSIHAAMFRRGECDDGYDEKCQT